MTRRRTPDEAAEDLYNFLIEHPGGKLGGTDQADHVKRLVPLALDAAFTLMPIRQDCEAMAESDGWSGWRAEYLKALRKTTVESFAVEIVKEVREGDKVTIYCYQCLNSAASVWFDLRGYCDTSARADLYDLAVQCFCDYAESLNKKDDLETHTKVDKPERYGIQKDKINRVMAGTAPDIVDLDGQIFCRWIVNQAGKDESDPVPVYMALTYEGDQPEVNRKKTWFDDVVAETVANMVLDAKKRGKMPPYCWTPEDIWRTMNGFAGTGRTPTKKQKTEIEGSVDKLRFTHFWMNISAEIIGHGLIIPDDRIKKGVYDGYYLPAESVMFKTERGRIVSGYRVLDVPFWYVYNMAKKHVLLIPYALLDTSDETGNEGNTPQFRLYLLREIESMYSGFRSSTRILYETIYSATGIPSPKQRAESQEYKSNAGKLSAARKYAQKDRDKIDALLTSWKSREYIKDFKPVPSKKGGSIVGVDIILNPENPWRTHFAVYPV